ncbi:MAG: hypothetical protein WBR29_03020 [Gammaproteobacteria bacterium]
MMKFALPAVGSLAVIAGSYGLHSYATLRTQVQAAQAQLVTVQSALATSQTQLATAKNQIGKMASDIATAMMALQDAANTAPVDAVAPADPQPKPAMDGLQ